MISSLFVEGAPEAAILRVPDLFFTGSGLPGAKYAYVTIAATAIPRYISKLCSRRRLKRQVPLKLPAGYNLPSWHLPLLRLVKLSSAPSSKFLTMAVSSDSTGSL